MSTASLGFAIDSSQAAQAASDLDRLTSSAAKVEQAATKVTGAGTRMSRGFADLNPMLDKIAGSLGRLEAITTRIDSRLGAMAQAATKAAKANSVLDQSAVEASSAYKQLEASLNGVTAAQKKSDAAQSASLAMIAKQKAAIASLNAELAKLRNTPMPSQPNTPRPANQNGQGGVGNIAAQLFDIGATAGFMSPSTVAIQQGPQLAQAFAGQSTKQALASLAGGLTAIVSPLSLAAIGLTGVAAAAIQYGVGLVTAATETKKMDDVLEQHDAVLKRLEDRYGSLVEKARGFTSESAKVLTFQSGSDVRALRSATNNAQYEVFNQTGSILGRVRGGTGGGNDLSVDSAYKPIEDALRRLRAEAKEGKPDFDAFYDSLYKQAALDPKFAKKADDLSILVEQFREGSKALQEMERIQRALFNDRGPNGMLLSHGPSANADRTSLTVWEQQQRVAALRRQQATDAQLAGINARSPQDRAAAARAIASSQYNNDESVADRRARIEQAGVLALAQAEKQLADARRDRALSLDKIIADQQQEVTLTGQTAGSVVALRKEYELTSALRLDAARQGIAVDEKEIELIKQKTAELGHLIDAQTIMMSRTVAAGNAQKYQADNVETLFRLRRTQGAALAGIGARSPQQIAAAARARAEAEPMNPNESPEVRNYRIEAAAALALAQAEQQVTDARRDRMLSLGKLTEDQQNEIDLIGKTGGAAVALRKEYELTSQLRMDAARQGIEVDQQELDLIKSRAAALGELTDKYNQQKFSFEFNQQVSDARLSSRSRQIIQTQRQYGLPENENDANGRMIGQQLDWQQAKDLAKGFGDAFSSELITGSHDIGKSFLKGFEAALSSEASKLWEKVFDGFGNMFADWLTGSKSGSGGAVGNVVAAITGKPANDNTAGGFSGLGKLVSGGGSSLGFVGNYKSGVDSRLTDILNTAATQFPGYKVNAMSGFRPGDPRFHGKGLATDVQLTDLASGKMLGNYQDASSFRQYEKFAQVARQVQMDKYPELADKFRWGGYFGGPKGKYGAVDTMHFDLGGAGMAGGSWKGGLTSAQAAMFPGADSQGMGSAVDAVNKLADSAGAATKGLDTFGGGLNKIGQSLSTSFFPSAPSASGGGGGWLSALFGGVFRPNGAQASLAASGKITGLFADGTNYAPGGLAIVGERGPELVDLPQGSQVFNTNKSAQMMGAANSNQPTGQPKYDIHIHGGSGDQHIRDLVQQGVMAAQIDQNDQMRRGTFGDMQRRYSNQKG